jgi:hypothetical protein
MATKNGQTTKVFPFLFFVVVESGNRDKESGMKK